jgi:hypothetical protein
MKLPLIKQISKEDLQSSDLPGWLDQFLVMLNQFITPVTQALQGKLTLSDNFQGIQIETDFTSGTALNVNPKAGRLRPIGVIPLYSAGAIVTGFGWNYNSDGTIAVTFTFSGGGTYKCRLFVFWG